MILTPRDDNSARQRAVLWGLGGFGKTRIALEYLKIYRKDYSAVIWINAGTVESAEESFAQAATTLRSRKALLPSMPPVGPRADMRLVKQWLDSRKDERWLIIIDRLDDLESFDCRELVPQCSHGTVLVTSTLSSATEVLGIQDLEVRKPDLVSAREMLLSGVGVQMNSDDGM